MKAKIIAEAKKSIAASAILIQNEAKDSMRKGKHGKTYRRGALKRNKKGEIKASKFHRASAAGEAPAVDTGRLMGSINHNLTDNGLTATVGLHDLTKVKYGKFLEYGTAKIAARPWLFPALEKNRDKIAKRIKAGLDKAMTAKGK